MWLVHTCIHAALCLGVCTVLPVAIRAKAAAMPAVTHVIHHHTSITTHASAPYMLRAVMSVTTLVISVACEQLGTVLPASPYFSSAQHTGITLCIIGLGAALAFMMVRAPAPAADASGTWTMGG